MNTKTKPKMKQMKTHRAADIYALNESDIEAIAESIKERGQKHAILALKDGSIVDGRNRWLACQKVGVDPIVKVINPGGEELTKEEISNIIIDENSMRRDETTSKRACAAAEMWKWLHPDETRGKNCTNAVFKDYAKANFKIGERYAYQALAILNYSAELFEDAKGDLAGTYKIYQERVSEDKEKRCNMELLNRSENADLKQRVENGELTGSEAVTLVRERHEKEIEAKQYAERARLQISDRVSALCDLSGDWTDPVKIAAAFNDKDNKRIVEKPSYQCLMNLAKTLNEVAAILKKQKQ